MKEIKTTNSQKEKILKIIKEKRYDEEVLWTYLVGDIIIREPNPFSYIRMICSKNYNSDFLIQFEGTPYPPRYYQKGSQIDLVLGNIRRRKDTESGIEYDPIDDSWVCFIEGKFGSDIKRGTGHDKYFSNQLMRDIEILLCFQSNKNFPEKLFFTLITPRIFKNNHKTSFYGYKIMDYISDKNEVLKDINLSELELREDKEDWIYPKDISKRLNRLTLNWISYEEIFEEKFDIKNLNLIKIKDNSEHLHLIEEYLDDLLQRLQN